MNASRLLNPIGLAAAVLLLGSCRAGGSAVGVTPDTPEAGPSAEADPVIVEDGARIRRLEEWIFGVAFSPDGKRLAAASRSGLTVYSAADFTPEFSLAVPQTPVRVEYSGDGRFLAYGTDTGGIHLLDARSGKELRTFAAENSRIRSLAFSPDGGMLAAGLSNHTVMVWKTDGSGQPKILKGHDFPVDSLSYSPGGDLLASASVAVSGAGEGVVVLLWETGSGAVAGRMTRQSSPIPVRPPAAVFFLPDGEQVAALAPDGVYAVWDAAGGETVRTVELELAGGGDVFALSHDGRLLAVGAVSGDVSLYDAAGGERTRLNEGRSGLSAVECAAFAPNGKTLATGTVEGTLTLWDLEDWE
jgi:WD40 repeat protein